MNEHLTTAKAAKVIGKSSHWLYVNSERLNIPRYRIGGRWIYFESELIDWFMRQKEVQQSQNAQKLKGTYPKRMHVDFS